MKKQILNNLLKKSVAILAAGAMLTMTACGNNAKDAGAEVNTESDADAGTSTDADVDTDASNDETEATANTKNITVEVTGTDGETLTYTVETEADFLLDVMNTMEGFTYEATEADWGYLITTINGEFADYDADGAYWAIYVNGEYGQNTCDAEPIVEGSTYSFVYTVYVADDSYSNVTISVTDAEGNTLTYEVATTAAFLIDVLDGIEGFTYDGYETDFGYYLTTINDVVADYDVDSSYWAVYVNGAYGENSIDAEPIADGAVYEFIYSVFEMEAR